MLVKIFLLVSLILNAYLFYSLILKKRGIAYFADILKDMSRGNFNRRIHAGLRYKSLEKLSGEINVLIDSFQNIMDQKQRLEISHKQLISNISHDIRTPLTSLLGYIEVVKDNKGISREEKVRCLDVIQAKGQYLYKMIEEFFELSKLESDDTSIKLVKTDLAETARGVLAAYYQDLKTGGINPVIKLPDAPVYVLGNGMCIERILGNLVSYAIKYGGDGGTIGIELRPDKQRVWLDVWDNGKGIPEGEIQFIFERLYTAEASRNENLRGSGLGLAIAKRLVEKQNGEISAASLPGQRTTFSFCLPSTL